MNLGDNIYHYRTQKNMSQGDLADALDVSRQSVSKWENNSAVPELEKLMKMAQVFDITIDELVTGEEKEIPTPPPAPMAAPTPAAKEGLSAQQILGIILLSLGGLLSIIFLLVGIFKENQYGEDMLVAFIFIGLPLILIGMICLLVKKHTGLKCAWAGFILLSAYFDYAAGINWTSFWSYLQIWLTHRDWAQHFNISVIISAIQWALLAILAVWTVKCYSKKPEALQFQDMVRLRISAVCNVLMLAVNFGLMQLMNQNVLPIRLLSTLSHFLNLVRLGLFVWLAVELWPWIRKRIRKGKQ